MQCLIDIGARQDTGNPTFIGMMIANGQADTPLSEC
jgi:hypothetical protein